MVGSAGLIEDGGQGFESPAAQAELTSALDERMAGEDLFEQRGARARQPDDEDLAAALETRAGHPGEEVAIERANQGVDESIVVVGRELIVARPERMLQRIGLAEALGRLPIVAPFVRDLGHCEKEPVPWSQGKGRVVQERSDCFDVGIGKLVAEKCRQPGMSQAAPDIETDRSSESRFGFRKVASLLEQHTQVHPRQ